MMTQRWFRAAGLVAALWMATEPAAAATAKVMYTGALAREQAIRAGTRAGQVPPLKDIRRVIAAYEAVVRQHPTTGYADNALWQAAMLASDAYRRSADEHDRRTAVRLLRQLVAGYPASSLIRTASTRLAELRADKPAAAALNPVVNVPPVVPAPDVEPAVVDARADARPMRFETVTLKDIRRVRFPELVRIIVELEGEVIFHQERIDNPPRVFLDLKGTRAAPQLLDAVLSFRDDMVEQIRVGRHPQSTTRVVIDLNNVARHSIFTLYNPFRIVIDCERREAADRPARPSTADPEPIAASPLMAAGARLPAVKPVRVPAGIAQSESAATRHESRSDVGKPAVSDTPIPSVRYAPTAPAQAPVPPAANLQGGFSLARQLGLGVSRIVIDPGHGGHDPGAMGGVVEKTLVLDVALRLETLLLKQPGVEVVLTRRTDEYVALEERTAIANRENADLFLSIHANASRNVVARGVETYFLNFATNPEAAAVAARENLTSGRTMNSLPDIVRAIALNTKLDESRDFATLVQQSMVHRLGSSSKPVRDLGVKQAPFVVLIGAAMPSVLAEIAFVTNKQDGTLLKSSAYRQRVAEALLDAIMRYQRDLKHVSTVAKGDAEK